jgi:transcriptional regulator with XRE-family HTH domain
MQTLMHESLKTLRVNLGWTQKQLASAAGVDPATVSRAERGENITAPKAKLIADTFSREYSREIRVADIEGLNVE